MRVCSSQQREKCEPQEMKEVIPAWLNGCVGSVTLVLLCWLDKQEENESGGYIQTLCHFPVGLMLGALWQKLAFSNSTTEVPFPWCWKYSTHPSLCATGHLFKTNNVHQMAHINSGDRQAILLTLKTRMCYRTQKTASTSASLKSTNKILKQETSLHCVYLLTCILCVKNC